MKKTYRISIYNKHTGGRELLWERYTSRKKAQEMADALNDVDPCKIIDARVFVEIR